MPERRRIDSVLEGSFVAALDEVDLHELRERRELAHDVENELSYYRRLLHARMDLVAFEQRRRRGEESRSLIDALASILSDSVLPGAGGTDTARVRPLVADVPPLPELGRREIDHLLGDDILIRLDEAADDELAHALGLLSDAESEISDLRRRVQTVEDAISTVIAGRYRTGRADPVGS